MSTVNTSSATTEVLPVKSAYIKVTNKTEIKSAKFGFTWDENLIDVSVMNIQDPYCYCPRYFDFEIRLLTIFILVTLLVVFNIIPFFIRHVVIKF